MPEPQNNPRSIPEPWNNCLNVPEPLNNPRSTPEPWNNGLNTPELQNNDPNVPEPQNNCQCIIYFPLTCIVYFWNLKLHFDNHYLCETGHFMPFCP
jgi:hypothetical protein